MIKLLKGRRGGGVLDRLKGRSWNDAEERDALLQRLKMQADLSLTDVGWMATDADPALRSTGFELIKTIGDPQTVDFFVRSWSQLMPVMRHRLARRMGELAPDGWERNLETFLQHKNQHYQTAAQEIVEASPLNPRIKRLLSRQLDRSDEESRRRALVRLLDNPDEADEDTIESYLSDPDENMRARVIAALARRLDPRYLDLFADRLESETYTIQQRLVNVLLEYAKAGHDVTHPLLPLISGGNASLRRAAVKILTQMPDQQRVVKAFIRYSKTLSGWVRQRALESLGEFQMSLLGPTLGLLGDPDASVRASAINLLRGIEGDGRIERALLPLLRDGDWWVRVCAAEALGERGTRAAVPHLVKLLRDPDSRWSALDALARLADPASLADVLSLLESPEPEMRAEVAKALPRFRDRRVVDALKRLCETDPSVEVRTDALTALRELGSDAVSPDETETLGRRVDTASYAAPDALPIVRLLTRGREQGASDVHISVDRPPMLRLRGELKEIPEQEPLDAETTLALLRPLLTPEQDQTLQDVGSVEICYAGGEQGRYRGSLFVDQKGLNAVFRIIPNKVPTLVDLGLPGHIAEVKSWHQGLVLVVGPAGSGKTTTLAALVNLINETRPAHIITLEDPIEYIHHYKRSLINQRQLSRDTASYQRALRAALREDPDVIVLGEMRDPETVRMAMEASETGHLVIATINGTGALRAVDRIINAFPPEEQSQIRMMLSDTLKLVIGQSLVPRSDGGGRVGLFEILIGLPTVGAVIRENRTMLLGSLMQTGRRLGMRTHDDSLEELVERRCVSAEEAYLRAQDKRRFEPFVSESFLDGVLA